MLSHINIGTGSDITIRNWQNYKKIVGFTGKVIFDTSKPDRTPRKLMDTTLMRKLGLTS